MANSRQPKWDWQTHLPRMIELYKGRLSIPDICDAIQCEGFTPCLSSVYSKFRSEGYPTDQNGRMKFLDDKFPEVQQVSGASSNVNPDDIPHESGSIQPSPLNPPSQDESEYSTPTSGTASRAISSFGDLPLRAQVQATDSASSIGDSASLSLSLDDTSESAISIKKETKLSKHDKQALENEKVVANLHKLGIIAAPKRKDPGLEYANRHKRTGTPRADMSSRSLPLPRPSRPDMSIRSLPLSRPPSIASTSSQGSAAMTKIRSWFKPKSDRPHTRHSVITEDSGYYSGRATPSTTFRETPSPHAESLREFQSLYRVACHKLHQPRHLIPYRDVPLCEVCLFSGIHNLAWSARHLSLTDFRAQLDIATISGVRELDAAGNSALHFVAASGAGYEFVKTLIDYGVNPYQLNTAGQSFLHCLRPYVQEPNPGTFSSELIKILYLVEPRLAFGQIDNDGRTVLHTLASYIADPRLRAQTFKLFAEAGCPPTTPDRFGNTASGIFPAVSQHSEAMVDSDIPTALESKFNTVNAPQELNEWELNQVDQIEAHKILSASYDDPHSVDAQSGDNVFHALSRLPSQKNDIHLHLMNFIEKGANLNLLNFKGENPLFSFIINRPPGNAETGATMCRYLDALLWRDSQHRISNKISVNMKNRDGQSALHAAAVRARPDSVRSLIAAGANVNSRSDNGVSILQATHNAKTAAVLRRDSISIHLFTEVISQLEYAGAVSDPSAVEERGIGSQERRRPDINRTDTISIDGASIYDA